MNQNIDRAGGFVASDTVARVAWSVIWLASLDCEMAIGPEKSHFECVSKVLRLRIVRHQAAITPHFVLEPFRLSSSEPPGKRSHAKLFRRRPHRRRPSKRPREKQ
jgi:hypothetical protein